MTNTIASGYNPLKLTNAEVGTHNGWRLLNEQEMQLTPKEIAAAQVCTDIEWYNEDYRAWDDSGWKACKLETYRTRLSPLELEAIRFNRNKIINNFNNKIHELNHMVHSLKGKIEELSIAIAKFDK